MNYNSIFFIIEKIFLHLEKLIMRDKLDLNSIKLNIITTYFFNYYNDNKFI